MRSSSPACWLAGVRAEVTARDGPGEYPERRPQRAVRDHRKDAGLAPLLVDGRPVVVGGDESPAIARRLEPVAVDVADRRPDGADDGPGDLLVRFECRDSHRDVILAEWGVIERLAIHVDDERVTDGAYPPPGAVHQHSGPVHGHVPVPGAENSEDGRQLP